jgi:hypothetical protein
MESRLQKRGGSTGRIRDWREYIEA